MTLSHDKIIARVQCFYDSVKSQSNLYEEMLDLKIDENVMHSYEIMSYELNKLIGFYEDLFDEIIV